MEIKPADSEVVDRRDLRYSRHNNMTTKWRKEQAIKKQAYVHTVNLVLDTFRFK